MYVYGIYVMCIRVKRYETIQQVRISDFARKKITIKNIIVRYIIIHSRVNYGK